MTPAMTPAEARAALGVDAAASPEEIRAAFRAQIGRHHPDVNPGQDTSARAVRLINAWAVLSALPAASRSRRRAKRSGSDERAGPPRGTKARRDSADAPTPPGPAEAEPDPNADVSAGRAAAWASDGSVLVAAPWEETMLWLVDAAHRVGDVTFLDPSSGLVEALVEFVDGPTVTLIMSLQGRAALTPDGSSGTEVWISMEPWSTPPRPDLPDHTAVAELVAHHLRTAAAELSPPTAPDG
ncbi:MAG: DnaJ domain-containing protein [Candidatus Microthrix sp.]|nr:DnaJ domain-containing protein [Candidatus Microthrix sp.]